MENVTFPEFLALVWGWISQNAVWFYVYAGGFVITWIVMRYIADAREDQRLLSVVWPITWSEYFVAWSFYELPRWIFRRLTNSTSNYRLDRIFDFGIWIIFKRKIDEGEEGILYSGPGPRANPIHRLRVTDPSLGKKYWLTVPNFCDTARNALFWTWGMREFDGEIADHV